ncbi:MAG: hypothetical protein H8E21_06055 [Gammaproteobacteria bacterium]|nr:hypothetical protein [Gammaproteobacteria bacterium]MBL6999208.1 hypothetical protein [Gammaproteobacteria bacterium]
MKKIIIFVWSVVFVTSTTQVLGSDEDWYSYWSVGISDNTYPSGLQSTFDLAEEIGFDRIELSIDAFGFYWPIGKDETINGFVVSGTNDTISFNGSEFSLKTYLYSYSVMHYFGQEPGDGFYLRGDVGFTRGVATTVTSSGTSSSTSDWGNGFLLGVGYGIPVSSGSRVILGFSYTSKTIEDEKYTATMFSIGGLW